MASAVVMTSAGVMRGSAPMSPGRGSGGWWCIVDGVSLHCFQCFFFGYFGTLFRLDLRFALAVCIFGMAEYAE